MRNGFRFAFFICTCVIRTLLCTLQTMQGLMPSTARTCLPAQSCDNPTNGGRGEQRSPAFIRLHGLYKFTPRNSSKRDVVFLQSRNCAAPLQVFGQVSAAAKSLCSVLGFTPFLITTLVSFANSSLLTPHLLPSSLDRFFYLKCTKMLEKY